MITENSIKNQPLIQTVSESHWQKQLANAYRSPESLLAALDLPVNQAHFSKQAEQQFSLVVPQAYVDKIKKGQWDDPLLRQVLPIDDEMQIVEGFGLDPVGDKQAMVAEGVLHKYHGRVLLLTTGACAIHCRYCFRRHFPYSKANPAKSEWSDALGYIAKNDDISEVILSGGDPLVLSDSRLQFLCESIASISHVKRLRIHTRLPIVLPDRIDNQFLAWFETLDLQKIVVVHVNHAQELGVDVAKVLSYLKSVNTLLLNQSVLLRGVNDSMKALSTLSECLIKNEVLPYYLHLLDRVEGASHFNVSSKEATKLMEGLRDYLPGYMVPKLVREISGEASKQPVE